MGGFSILSAQSSREGQGSKCWDAEQPLLQQWAAALHLEVLFPPCLSDMDVGSIPLFSSAPRDMGTGQRGWGP